MPFSNAILAFMNLVKDFGFLPLTLSPDEPLTINNSASGRFWLVNFGGRRLLLIAGRKGQHMKRDCRANRVDWKNVYKNTC